MMKAILNDKYRPREFEDVIGLDPDVKTAVEKRELPHYLFTGPAGSGKTTTALIIARKLDAEVLTLNASKDRGIDTIRERIIPFVQKKSDRLKIVFLDEFDATTPAFQTALRNEMEGVGSNTRFIATCNYLNKIIEPVQSRFKIVKFNPMDRPAIVKRLSEIATKEGITYESDEILHQLVDKYKTDIRAMINALNGAQGGKLLKVTDDGQELLKKLVKHLSAGEWFQARGRILEEPSVDYEELITKLEAEFYSRGEVSLEKKLLITIASAEAQQALGFSHNKEIVIAAFMARIVRTLKQ